MANSDFSYRRYAIAGLLGAIGGGLLVALATKAIPKMMARTMSAMMRNMMAQMGDCRCGPAEI